MVKPDIQKMQNIPSDLSQVKPREKNSKVGFIDLKEAAKLFGYTQHHFGLLCRQEKLRSKRIGKKWMTKKEWIEKYLNDVEENYKKTNNHYTQLVGEKKVVEKKEKIVLPKKKKARVPHFAFLQSPSWKNATAVSFIAVLLWSYAFLGLRVSENYSDISEDVKQMVTRIGSINSNQGLRLFTEDTKNNYAELSNSVIAMAMNVADAKDNAVRAYVEADNKVVRYVDEIKSEIKKKMNFSVPIVVSFSLDLRAKSINIIEKIYLDLTEAHRVAVSNFNHYLSYASFMSDFDLNRNINNIVNSCSASLFTFIDNRLIDMENAQKVVNKKTKDFIVDGSRVATEVLYDVNSGAKKQYFVSKITQISDNIDAKMASLPKAIAGVFSMPEGEVLPEKGEKVGSFAYSINGDGIKNAPRKIESQLAYLMHTPKLAFEINNPINYMRGGGFVELEPVDFIERTRENIVAFKDDMAVWGGKSKDTLVHLAYVTADYIKSYGNKIKLAFFDADEIEIPVIEVPVYVDKKEEDVFVSEEIELPEAREGMVVLPEELVGGDFEKMEREIKDIFSDEVLVTPDEEGDAGIIYPVFKKGRGEEYLYVMVPVDKKEESAEKEI